MFPGMNSRQAKQLMKQMGLNPIELDADFVIIKQKDRNLFLDVSDLTEIKIQGQHLFSITSNNVKEITNQEVVDLFKPKEVEINEDDIKLIQDQTGVSKEIAIEYLKKNNYDLAQTILELSNKKQEE